MVKKNEHKLLDELNKSMLCSNCSLNITMEGIVSLPC